MRFLAIKNNNGVPILYAVLLEISHGHIAFLAYNFTTEDLFRHFLGRGRVVVEKQVDDRTIHKQELRQDDPGYFEALKTRIPVPFAVYMSGEIVDQDPTEALVKIWKMFSLKEPRQVIEVNRDAQKIWRSH